MSVYRFHVARVQFVIEKKYADAALTVEAVARLIGISTQHVCRVLRRERGLTFAELLRAVRLREARRLLDGPKDGNGDGDGGDRYYGD